VAAACSNSPADDVAAAQARVTSAQQAVDEAEAAIPQARSAFCDEANDYIIAIDRYGKLFVDSTATVGDVRTLGADLGQPRESTAAAARAALDAYDALNQANQELADAQAALAEAQASASPGKKTSSAPKPPVSASPNVPAASVDRVPQGAAGTKCCPTVSARRPAQGHRIGTDDK